MDMSKKLSTRIAAAFLIVHGLIEVMGLVGLNSAAEMLESFGGMDKTQIAANSISVVLLGVLWGLTRFTAAWGIFSGRKWAISLGIAISMVTLIASISIIPAGVLDTFLAVPVLVLLLYGWFGGNLI